jgi:hypothetical protein
VARAKSNRRENDLIALRFDLSFPVARAYDFLE